MYRAKIIEGTSHWPQLDKPEVFNQILDDFLRQIKNIGKRRRQNYWMLFFHVFPIPAFSFRHPFDGRFYSLFPRGICFRLLNPFYIVFLITVTKLFKIFPGVRCFS